ncbi:site-specific integrase [Legionella sp. PC1000]|nr:site-specific integrase [Legionella sp. PC1000]
MVLIPASIKVMKKVEHERSANSFEIIAREWFVKYSSNWVKSHSDKIIQRFERDIFPWIGNKPITDVSPPVLLSVIRRIEERGALETAHRALSNCGQVFRYAIATGRAERDSSQDLKGALPPVKTKHFAAQTDPKHFGELLRVLDGYEGSLIVRCALRLAPLVFVRPGELRHAKWADIDFDDARWSYIVTKTDTPHIVPLAIQALAILKELHPLTGNGIFVFPSARSNARPMSDNAILAALRRLGISKEEATGHGFRATARTLLDEVLAVRPDIIEHQLAHAVRDPNGRAYNRTAHLVERRKMMQDWANYLDFLKIN